MQHEPIPEMAPTVEEEEGDWEEDNSEDMEVSSGDIEEDTRDSVNVARVVKVRKDPYMEVQPGKQYKHKAHIGFGLFSNDVASLYPFKEAPRQDVENTECARFTRQRFKEFGAGELLEGAMSTPGDRIDWEESIIHDFVSGCQLLKENEFQKNNMDIIKGL